MALMDEFKKEREEIKSRPFKERMAYYWGYYKWHAIAIAAGVFFLGSLIHHYVTMKEIVLYVALPNITLVDDAEQKIHDVFLMKEGLNTKEEDITLDDAIYVSLDEPTQETMAGTQKVAALIYSKGLDMILTRSDYFTNYAYQEVFMNPEEYLSAEEFAAFREAGRIYYIDLATLASFEADMADGTHDESVPIPDPTDPDAMKEPRAAGIIVDEIPLLDTYAICADEGPYMIGIPTNSQHVTLSAAFLDFLLKTKP